MGDLSFPMWLGGAGTESGPPLEFASTYGVTGVNSGSRDDAILLRNAMTTIVAAGGKTLVLPVGVVYLNSSVTDASYPYNYCVKNTTDDFTIVIPAGCIVYMTVAGSLGGNNTAAFLMAGAATVNRARCMGGGRIVHTLPLTANNNCSAVYVPSAGVDCVIDNLSAYGFGSTTVAAFDSSSSFKGTLTNLRAESCYIAVAQSSAQTTARHVISNINIIDAYFEGFTCDSGNNIISDVSVDQSAITPAASYYGAALNGPVGNTTITNMKLKGNPAVAGAGETGLKIRNGNSSDTGKIAIFGLVIDGYESGVTPQGTKNAILIDGFEIKNFVYGVWKTAYNAVNCNDVTLRDGILDTGTYGLLSGGSVSDATQGYYNLDNVQFLGTITTKYYNTSGAQIGFYNNLANAVIPAIAIQSKYQRVVATAASTVTATVGIDDLTLDLVPAGTLATLTVVFPTSAVDGQRFTLRSSQIVTTLTVTGTVAGSPVALTAGYSRTFIYDGTATTWM